jgi:hypothetical protein
MTSIALLPEDRSQVVYEGLIMNMHIVTSETGTAGYSTTRSIVVSQNSNNARATHKGQLQSPDSSSPDFDFHHVLGSARDGYIEFDTVPPAFSLFISLRLDRI